MRIDPKIRALRGNASAQRRARRSLERAASGWRERPDVAAVLGGLESYGKGAALDDCVALASLMSDLAGARGLVEGLAAEVAGALRLDPLGHVPLRHQLAEDTAVLQLARAGRATLSLIQYRRSGNAEAPRSVCFTDGERHEICLAGAAEARHVALAGGHANEVRLKFENISLSPGSTHAFIGRGTTKIVDRIAAPLTLLRLSRQAETPLPSLEYRLSDGVLLHRAAGDCRESRVELMLALLGRMERRDAVPAMLALTRSGSDSLRWQALRECLALDSAAGFGALAAIARDSADPLHAPAASLHADLRARHPQLAQPEFEPCPA